MGRRSFLLITILAALAALACSAGFSPSKEADIQTVPLVLLIAPVNGSTYADGTHIELFAIAQDPLAGVSRVEFRVDDLPLGEVKADNPDGQPSLEARFTWTAAGKQGHLISVEAFRADGSSLGLNEVAVTVTDKPGVPAPPGEAPPPDTSTGEPGSATTIPTPTNAPASTSPAADMGILTGALARVNSDNLYVRQGPGTNYPPVGTLNQGDRVPIVGHNADNSWWAVSYGEGTGWVFASLVITEGDLTQVPLVAAPPP